MLISGKIIHHKAFQLGTVFAIHDKARKQLQVLDNPGRVVDPRHVQLGQKIMMAYS